MCVCVCVLVCRAPLCHHWVFVWFRLCFPSRSRCVCARMCAHACLRVCTHPQVGMPTCFVVLQRTGGGGGSPSFGNPKALTASYTPSRATPCSVQMQKYLHIKLPLKAASFQLCGVKKQSERIRRPKHLLKTYGPTGRMQCHWHLHCRPRSVSPRENFAIFLKDKSFYTKLSPARNPPPPQPNTEALCQPPPPKHTCERTHTHTHTERDSTAQHSTAPRAACCPSGPIGTASTARPRPRAGAVGTPPGGTKGGRRSRTQRAIGARAATWRRTQTSAALGWT